MKTAVVQQCSGWRRRCDAGWPPARVAWSRPALNMPCKPCSRSGPHPRRGGGAEARGFLDAALRVAAGRRTVPECLLQAAICGQPLIAACRGRGRSMGDNAAQGSPLSVLLPFLSSRLLRTVVRDGGRPHLRL